MGDPEELKRQHEEMMDGMRMAREVAANEIKDFLSNASQEHLDTIRKLLHQIGHEDALTCAAYYEGLITSALLSRFDICLGCGEVHDPDEHLLDPSEGEEE